jgi:alkanesulfonate monooxygenase SsuD/methylene tetrahydromethanopterin reductase-like flavin-dependent oxidoreductase (luciferase family)
MKFSYVMLPDYPLEESLRAIKLADELGFYGCYAADETWHKDLWLLFAAAAKDTTNIRFGPSLSGVVLREPTLIAQAAATLDELTDGRAEVVLGSGNFGLLAQYDIDWARTKPLSRVKEGVQVLRTLLDDGAITFDGEFFKYHGLFTFARPVQEHLPVKIGSMRARSPSRSRVNSPTVATTHWATRDGPMSTDSNTSAPVPRGLERTQMILTSRLGFVRRSGGTRRQRSRQPAPWSGSMPHPCRMSCSNVMGSTRRS